MDLHLLQIKGINIFKTSSNFKEVVCSVLNRTNKVFTTTVVLNISGPAICKKPCFWSCEEICLISDCSNSANFPRK